MVKVYLFDSYPDPYQPALPLRASSSTSITDTDPSDFTLPNADLHLWTERHFLALPDLFEPIPPTSEEYLNDPCIAAIHDSTEEGKKVARNNGDKYILVWRRKEDPVRETGGWVL